MCIPCKARLSLKLSGMLVVWGTFNVEPMDDGKKIPVDSRGERLKGVVLTWKILFKNISDFLSSKSRLSQ